MSGPKWINADDLNRWAATPAAKYMLPELLRRLVRATVDNEHLRKLDFPSEGEVQRPGYDGTTVTTKRTLFVPEGIAFWELGCEVGNVKRKANSDYKNRIDEHEKKLQQGTADDISQATYIAVTALDWMRAEEWAKEKRAEGKFRCVDAYDSNRLEHWIWDASAVGLWLAQEIHGNRRGLWDVQTRWNAMQATLTRNIAPEVLLVNRTKTASTFQEWLDGPNRELAIKAPSREELVDVFCAWTLSLPLEQQEAILSRAIIVEDRETWRSLAESPNPLILIAAPALDGDKELYAIAASSHHVLRFAPFTAARNSGAVEMERMRRFDLQQMLKEIGMPDADANRIAEAAGGNFTILRRLLASTPAVKTPTWASDGELAPLLLAPAWKDENSDDQGVIAKLANRAYSEVRRTLVKWWQEPDQPVRLIDGTWEFLSPIDAWQGLHPSLIPFLDTFEQIAVQVLSEDNPALDLAPEDRPMAALKGKARRHSKEIRHGIAEVLALGVSREDESSVGMILRFAQRATRIIQQLLPEGCGWKRWASLGDVLAQLMEADPIAVVEAMERDLRCDAPALVELMRQEVPGAFGQEYQSGVLWALERAAWPPELLPRASILLAKLDQLDPGGTWTNRARNSLRGLFFSWMPQTMASVGERIELLRILVRRTPEAAWRLLLNLLPTGHETMFPHSTPSYRDWAAGWTGKVSDAEYQSYISGVADLVTLMAEGNSILWLELLDKINGLALQFPHESVKMRERFESHVAKGVPAALKVPYWEKLRALVLKHTQFADTWWALPQSEVNRFAVLRDQLQPESNIITLKPLFDDSTLWDRDESSTFEQKIERRNRERRAAVRSIWEEGGITLLFDLIEQVKQPYDLGYAIADELQSMPEAELIPSALTSEKKAFRDCAGAYAAKRIWTEGSDWAEALPSPLWSDQQVAIFGQQMPFRPRTWDWIGGKGEIAESLYWQNVRVWDGFNLPEEDALRAVKRLQAAGRAWSALQILAMRLDKKVEVPPQFLCDALDAILSNPLEHFAGAMDVHYAQQAFSALQNNPEADTACVARLEFGFLPMLDRHSLLPRTLHRELARDPKFFVECLQVLYRSHNEPIPTEGEEPAAASEEDAAAKAEKAEKAKRVWQLLHDWQTIPGSDLEGRIDLAALREWVSEARRQAAEADRLLVCDSHIGQVFARSAEDDLDNAKPRIPIREIIEECESQEIENGFAIGLHNLRGAHWKGLYDGGKQERELAMEYERYANTCAAWLRTSAVLRGVAESYSRQGEQEDERAKARE